MAIRLQNRQHTVVIHTPRLKRSLRQIMAYLRCDEKELSVVLADDQFLRELNRTYRHKDYTPNVLAFPQFPASAEAPAPLLLGDVVVSLPTAAREAQEVGEPLEDYVTYLLLHGILHLLGYDHEQSPDQHRQMAALEQEVLAHLEQGRRGASLPRP